MQSVIDVIKSYETNLQKANTELIRTRDIFSCFLMAAYEEMKRHEEIVFHDPSVPLRKCGREYHSKKSYFEECPFCVRIRKTKVIEENNGFPRNSTFLYYISRELAEASVAGVKEAMKGIAKSPVSKRITSEMVAEKYDQYLKIRKEIGKDRHLNSRIMAIERMLKE
jgi:hypothetical protein